MSSWSFRVLLQERASNGGKELILNLVGTERIKQPRNRARKFSESRFLCRFYSLPSGRRRTIMGKLMMQNDRENMKIVMLKHEETFKQQVRELHRLYRVQKIMMNDIKAEVRMKRERWDEGDERNSDIHLLPAEDCIGKDGDLIAEIKEESNLELTLATGDRRKKSECSANTDSGASFSSSSAEFSSAKLSGHEWGTFQLNSFQSKGKSEFDGEEQVRKEMMVKQSPWLLQCLSFDMTL